MIFLIKLLDRVFEDYNDTRRPRELNKRVWNSPVNFSTFKLDQRSLKKKVKITLVNLCPRRCRYSSLQYNCQLPSIVSAHDLEDTHRNRSHADEDRDFPTSCRFCNM
jgi:hypothetical protein